MTYRDAAPNQTILIVGFGGVVIALDPTTGRRYWLHHCSDPGMTITTRVIVHGERVYALLGLELHVLDYATGRLLRMTPVPHKAVRTFAILENRLIAAGSSAVVAFDFDGNLVWADPFADVMGGDQLLRLASVSIAVPGYSEQGDPMNHGIG